MKARRPGKGHVPRWGQILRERGCTVGASVRILRELYPSGSYQERPAWAQVARKFGWMSFDAYMRAVPWKGAPWKTAGIPESFYESMPLLALKGPR